MKDSDHQARQKLLLAALDDASEEARERMVEQVCGQDADEREAVSRFLRDFDASAREVASDQVFVPGKLIGERYRIVAPLGRGGMGVVYRAEDLKLGQTVALKFLPRSLASNEAMHQALFNEVRQARKVSHRHVCRVFDIGEEDALLFLSMEYIEGENLASLLRRIGRLPRRKAFELGRQLCAGLQAAHEEGLVHLDLKPANLMIDERGLLRITDFGLARLSGEVKGGRESRAGTPAYMAPEQLLEGASSLKSDLYAAGLVLHEMFTGESLHARRNLGEVVAWHESGETPVVSASLAAPIAMLVSQCVARDPVERPESAAWLLRALDEAGAAMEADASTSEGLDGEVGEGGKAPPVTVLPSEKVRSSDVLITYAPVDDQSAMPREGGWISQLHRNLELRVAQLSGQQVAVVKQPDAAENEAFDKQVIEEVPQAKTVVSIVSPPFVQANGCRRLVHRFYERAEASGLLSVDDQPRLFSVVKTPVESEDMPEEIRAIYERLVPYEFFDRDPETGRVRIFDESFGGLAIQRFHERVYDVAYDLSRILKGLSESGEETDTAATKTIFLAATTSDLAPQRDQLRRELTEMGHRVLPRQTFPLVATEITAMIGQALEQADLAIHPVGAYYGLVPEATDLSVVALQSQVAAEVSRRNDLPRIVWIPKDLEPRDARQAIFLQQLESDPALLSGADLVRDTLENLKVLLRARWQKERETEERKGDRSGAGMVDQAPRVYLICDERDQEAIEPLEDFFYEQGIDVSLPGFEADESEVQEIHLQNLRDCDGALIFYGGVGMHWVDFSIRDLQKAAGYREGKPIPVSGVYVAPPFTRRKERFKSVSVDLLRQEGEIFEAKLLENFVAALREAKSGEVAS